MKSAKGASLLVKCAYQQLFLSLTDVNPAAFQPADLPDDAASLKAMLLLLMAELEREKQCVHQQAQRAHQQQYRADGLQKKSDVFTR